MATVTHQLRASATASAVEPSSSAVRTALTDIAPFALALVPFALAIGTASATNGLTLTETIFGAVVLLAGTAQLAATEMIGSGSGIVITVLTIMLINLRFAIYGASLNQWFDGLSKRTRLLLAIPLVDQSFMVSQERFAIESDHGWRRRYYLVVSAALIGAFVSCQIVGYRVGADLPRELGMHLAAPLAFAGMLGKTAKGKQPIVAAVVSGIGLLLLSGLPGGVALPAAVLAGVAAGRFGERTSS